MSKAHLDILRIVKAKAPITYDEMFTEMSRREYKRGTIYARWTELKERGWIIVQKVVEINSIKTSYYRLFTDRSTLISLKTTINKIPIITTKHLNDLKSIIASPDPDIIKIERIQKSLINIKMLKQYNR